MADVQLTEMTELDPEELHLVKTGANGFSPLLAKAVKEEVEAAKSDSKEADEIERLLTGDAAKSLCGVLDCVVCQPTLSKMPISDTLKERLTSASRDALPDSAFVFPKQRKYPIHDEAHARNALSRVAGKESKERKVRAAVAREFPQIGQAEKSPGNPESATTVPATPNGLPYWPAVRHDHTPKGSEVGKIREIDPSAGHGDSATGPVGAGAAPKIQTAKRAVTPNPSIPGVVSGRPGAVKAYAFTTLAGFLERVEAQREVRAIKEPWVSGDNPEVTHAPEPTFKQEAEKLLAFANGGGDPAVAKEALDCALSIAARLSLDEQAVKAEFQLSGFSTQALSAASDQIAAFLAAPTPSVTEADEIMTTLTKEELDAKIAEGAQKAAKDAFKKERKQLKKAAKQLRRALKGQSNNKGEISEGDMKSKIRAKRTADDVAIPGSGVTKASGETTSVTLNPEPVKTEKVKKDKKKGLQKQLSEINDLVQKMAKRPVVGGPHLTGTPAPGTTSVPEGRQGEVVKSAEDTKIEGLRTELAELMKSHDMNAPNRIQAVSYELSRLQLAQGHRLGEI